MSVKARSWDEIERRYTDLNNNGWGHDRLLKLVQHIKSTEVSNRLFAYTTLDKLVISIYEVIDEILYLIFDSSEIEKLSNKSVASETGISYSYSGLVAPIESPFIVK